MTTVYDVPADPLIKKVAEKLKGLDTIKAPEWAPFVTTGTHAEKAPENKNWWHVRVAAVLRKVYVRGPIGTERLAGMFGGSRDRGSKPDKAVKGSRAIIRNSLKQLEAAKLIEQTEKKKGRVVTAQGQKLLNDAANDVRMELAKSDPELMKY